MTSSLDSICIEMLKFVNEIDKQKKKLEETLLEGRFNLSKSRIIIGKERLSSTSYPVESSASFKVDIKFVVLILIYDVIQIFEIFQEMKMKH